MSEELDKFSDSAVLGGERPDVILSNFLSNCAAVQLAAASVRAGAEVAITFTDMEGDWRIWRDGARIAFDPGKAKDPDFELRMPPRAVDAICSRLDADIGDLGVSFFEHIVSRDPKFKIQVTIHSGVMKLTGRGWLGLLTRGGSKVVMWMTRKGLRGPGAIATALGRLKS